MRWVWLSASSLIQEESPDTEPSRVRWVLLGASVMALTITASSLALRVLQPWDNRFDSPYVLSMNGLRPYGFKGSRSLGANLPYGPGQPNILFP